MTTARTAMNHISTHALREEGDSRVMVAAWTALVFLPTPSVRRATASPCGGRAVPLPISTHALREEGDSKCAEK